MRLEDSKTEDFYDNTCTLVHSKHKMNYYFQTLLLHNVIFKLHWAVWLAFNSLLGRPMWQQHARKSFTKFSDSKNTVECFFKSFLKKSFKDLK